MQMLSSYKVSILQFLQRFKHEREEGYKQGRSAISCLDVLFLRQAEMVACVERGWGKSQESDKLTDLMAFFLTRPTTSMSP